MADLSTQVIIRGTTAAIPTATVTPTGALYVETDLQRRVYRNNGTTWDAVGYAGGAVSAITFIRMNDTASAAATNVLADTWNDVSESLSAVNYRQIVDLRGMTTCRIMGRIGGALVANTRVRIQYNPTSDPNVTSVDAGWAELATSAGSHTLSTPFLSAEITIPTAARVFPCIARAGIYGGDGAVDPTVTGAILMVYPQHLAMSITIGGLGVVAGSISFPAGAAGFFFSSVQVRFPSLAVYIGGVLDERAYAARVSLGFDQRYAEATVYRSGGTAYPPPDPASMAINYWSTVEIQMGVTNVATRFSGWAVPIENQQWPQTNVLHCKGTLYLAEFVKNEENGGTDLSEDGTGHADEGQVRAVLAACGVPYSSGNIGGTGLLLGSLYDVTIVQDSEQALLSDVAIQSTPFWWAQGSSGLSYIDSIDQVSVPAGTAGTAAGRYRTFEGLDGTVRRELLTAAPSTEEWTFTEGQDIVDGTLSITRDPSEAANRVSVSGCPREMLNGDQDVLEVNADDDEIGPVFFQNQLADTGYISSAVPVNAGFGFRVVSAPPFSSQMIEKSTLALSGSVIAAQSVVDQLLAEYNAVKDTVQLDTPRDDSFEPGDTFRLVSGRLAANTTYWIQRLEIDLDEQGAFTQRITGVRRG